MAQQEPGIKPSCALPYQLYADGRTGDDGRSFILQLEARKDVFGDRSAGSPFNLFQPGMPMRSYAVVAGGMLAEQLPIKGDYYFEVHGPNGFCRQYKGHAKGPLVRIDCEYERSSSRGGELTGRVQLRVHNRDTRHGYHLVVKDMAYQGKDIVASVAAGATADIVVPTAASHGWYDFAVTVSGVDGFEQRYSGRVETGKDGYTDPAMGG